ncbi:A/G-specific adenine glycosylase [Candidatus Cerribacteria bacterium 'Amazon FNV 2010 28 9']|uniref:Adenine DNA glycosylase n=1 Tax=Candidatus Cerribacteria bacterium 'Amazon FNV 2010 28 9' TaxID=2081795 RepID=A0A317JU75_9BACT|nr:MAG: A/G-specific adenine glycosylase [Candidatus Cerribacteria bacterium 'Amazon FNV 2010 28 9']
MTKFQSILLNWFSKHGRELPWRTPPQSSPCEGEETPPLFKRGKQGMFLRDPYLILISELMLQQTQVSRVLPKFTAFIEKWPTFANLTSAKQSDVIIMWQGLGYNRRAKFLWQTASVVTEQLNGIFPSTVKDIQTLPGIGPYTARALAIFALGLDEVTIDTNIRRILARVCIGTKQVSEKELYTLAKKVVPEGKADAWHQALMDFGSLVCLAKNPLCESCPLAEICVLNNESKQLGCANAADWLARQPKTKKVGKKDVGKKFEETDRYFRGRIIDFLRTGEQPMEALQSFICIEKKLNDLVRFGEIIEALVKEHLIEMKGNNVRLK